MSARSSRGSGRPVGVEGAGSRTARRGAAAAAAPSGLELGIRHGRSRPPPTLRSPSIRRCPRSSAFILQKTARENSPEGEFVIRAKLRGENGDGALRYGARSCGSRGAGFYGRRRRGWMQSSGNFANINFLSFDDPFNIK